MKPRCHIDMLFCISHSTVVDQQTFRREGLDRSMAGKEDLAGWARVWTIPSRFWKVDVGTNIPYSFRNFRKINTLDLWKWAEKIQTPGNYPEERTQQNQYNLYHVVASELRTNNQLIITIIISFMQGIYTYIPEKNYVPREYSVAAVLLLLFMVLVSLVSVFVLKSRRMRVPFIIYSA